jgi:lysozyme family protein
MKENFGHSLAYVLQNEGGYVNDPADPGGETNKGVTQQTYDDWRTVERLPKRSLRFINGYELGAIYRRNFWDACRCDDLPGGVDYCVFDFAVNSGVNRACRYLQRVASVSEDGIVGPQTIAAISTLRPESVIDALCDLRLGFLQQLPTFKRFGDGWTTRVAEVHSRARAMTKAMA